MHTMDASMATSWNFTSLYILCTRYTENPRKHTLNAHIAYVTPISLDCGIGSL